MFSILALTNFAQENQYQINGRVVDAQTNEPIALATVKCNNIAVAANENGNFAFGKAFAKGKYKLVVTNVGFTTKEQTVEVENKNVTVEIQLEKATTKLQDLEVTSIRANDKAPFSKTNLNKTDIERLNQGQDLPFILNQTPSVVINSDAGNGVGYTGIRIRGTDATRINVTLNGIPYNDAESQGSYFVDLPDFTSSVNSIQIQRGVGTSSNGTGAFGATINLSTNEINEKPYTEINNSYGSFNTWKNTIKAGTGLINNHFIVDARLSQIKSNGYVDRASSNLQAAAISATYLNKNSSVRFNFFSGKEKTYQAWNGIDSSKLATNPTYNSSGTDKPGNPYDNETDNYWQKHYQLFYNQALNNNWSFNVAAFYSKGFGYYENYNNNQKYTKYGVTNSPIATTDLIKQQWLDNDFYGQIFSVQYKKNKNNLTIGGSWTNYKGNHNGQVIWAANGGFLPNQKYYDVDAKKWERSFYTKLQHNISNSLSLFVDVQYRFVEHDMKGFKKNPTLFVNRKFSFLNPKLGLSYTKNNWQTYFSYALANKEPNRDDFETGITTQPKEEKLHDFEFGIEKKAANYSFGATVYYMLYQDQLVLTGKLNDVGNAIRTNVNNSYRLGIELQGTYVFAKWLNANANLTLSQNKIKEFTELAYDETYTELQFKHSNTNITLSPSVISHIQLNFIAAKNVAFSLIGKYVGKQYLDNTQNEERTLKNYYTQDAKATYKLQNKLFKEALLMLSVNNIFNKKYTPNGATYNYVYGGVLMADNYYFPMAGTNFMISLNIKL